MKTVVSFASSSFWLAPTLFFVLFVTLIQPWVFFRLRCLSDFCSSFFCKKPLTDILPYCLLVTCYFFLWFKFSCSFPFWKMFIKEGISNFLDIILLNSMSECYIFIFCILMFIVITFNFISWDALEVCQLLSIKIERIFQTKFCLPKYGLFK